MRMWTVKSAAVAAAMMAASCASGPFAAAPLQSAEPAEAGPAEAVTLHPALAAFSPLIGGVYRGEPVGRDGPADIQRWSAALGGAAVRITHALEDGAYGGETLVYPTRGGGLAYAYVTTAGFMTTGVMTVNPDGSWTAEEAVDGHPTITRVRSTGAMGADGTLTSRSEYLDDGTWVAGHGFAYVAAPEAALVFPDVPDGPSAGE